MATATAVQVRQPRTAAPTRAFARLESVDLLRGAVMVLMVLDHVRAFFSGAWVRAGDVSQTTAPLFLTRWITHFCAPAFVFLAGTGVFLAATRGKPRGELSRFLVLRGFWLVLLELTVVRFGMVFNLDYHYIPAGVLWAIGWSMVILAGLIWLPMRSIVVFAIVLIAGHNLLDGIEPEMFGRFGWVWKVLHEKGSIRLWRGVHLKVIYPLIPWAGVMAAGYVTGAIFALERRRRRPLLCFTGLSLIGAFVVLRAWNHYGDPDPWSIQRNPLFTAFSFLACEKYPPSLLFLLMTLGPVILALGLLDRTWGPAGQRLVMLGRVPLFFYLVQWPLVHALALIVAILNGQPYHWLFASRPFRNPPGSGFGLPIVYGMWVVAILLLYPACRWFADLKRRRKDAWLRYF
jgi:uncharacterized membrane protein